MDFVILTGGENVLLPVKKVRPLCDGVGREMKVHSASNQKFFIGYPNLVISVKRALFSTDSPKPRNGINE